LKERDDMKTTMHPLSAAAIALAATLGAGAAAADELPAFRKGMWEYDRTMERGGAPKQTVKAKKCINPTEDMNRQRAMLSQSGCKFSPIAKSGSTYTYTAQCTMAGLTVESKSVLRFESEGAYRLDVESKEVGVASKEVLIARRVGDC
jgi:hypothetical protein